jgi:hypothetical protein
MTPGKFQKLIQKPVSIAPKTENTVSVILYRKNKTSLKLTVRDTVGKRC